MSRAAKDLIGLLRLTQRGARTLTQHLLLEVAKNVWAVPTGDRRTVVGGCDGSRQTPIRFKQSAIAQLSPWWAHHPRRTTAHKMIFNWQIDCASERLLSISL
jgi:hypothetical protein